MVRCTDSRYGRKNEPLCHPCTMKLLQQWGDLRAEQVRRETVEACANVATALYPCQCDPVYVQRQRHGPDCRRETCEDVADEVRRAFAASQGGKEK